MTTLFKLSENAGNAFFTEYRGSIFANNIHEIHGKTLDLTYLSLETNLTVFLSEPQGPSLEKWGHTPPPPTPRGSTTAVGARMLVDREHRAQIFEMVGVKFRCIFLSIKLLERNFE